MEHQATGYALHPVSPRLEFIARKGRDADQGRGWIDEALMTLSRLRMEGIEGTAKGI